MYLIYEDLARIHIRELHREAREARAAYGLLHVRKAQRKADQAKLAAKRLLASLVLD